jgi:hypothetical protein
MQHVGAVAHIAAKLCNVGSVAGHGCKSRAVMFKLSAAQLGLGVRGDPVHASLGNAMTAFPLRRLPCSNDASSVGACTREAV